MYPPEAALQSARLRDRRPHLAVTRLLDDLQRVAAAFDPDPECVQGLRVAASGPRQQRGGRAQQSIRCLPAAGRHRHRRPPGRLEERLRPPPDPGHRETPGGSYAARTEPGFSGGSPDPLGDHPRGAPLADRQMPG